MKRRSYTPCDAVFTAKVDSWRPVRRGFLEAFGRERFGALDELNRRFDPGRRKIVFLTFENRYAQLGGLAAVMRYLPTFLRKYGEDVISLTPLYINIPAVKDALENGALEPVIRKKKFRSSSYEGTLNCYRDTDTRVTAYFIGVEGRFTASQNPYSYADSESILDDSLAFCAAVPVVLRELGFTMDILFHAHDWETAPIALTSKIAMLNGVLGCARTVLTLHNSFDSGIGVDKRKKYFGGCAFGDTILQNSIPLLNGPLTTVSMPFAAELRADPLQRTVFTSHLQNEFSENPPVGIENGMFGRPRLQYTFTALSRARQGEYGALLSQKAAFRDKMLKVVSGMDRPEVIGCLKGVTDGKPIFFMSGRLDLMQKGFDVIFRALEKIPAGRVGLIFCPSSAEGNGRVKELALFRRIAEERAGDVVVWPFRISAEDYVSAVSGSSFLLMPSFYEPFGAATEGFMHGTPVIARASGGLLAQVRPLGAGDDDGATGILYRDGGAEPAAIGRPPLISEAYARACEEWKQILDSPVEKRIEVPLYISMVAGAYGALRRAEEVFADERAYGRMMVNGMDSLRDFSWDAAVLKYRRIYDTASRRGFFDD